MNFITKNSELRKEVIELLGEKLSYDGIVNFSVSYSQNQRITFIVVELSRSSVLHCLIFVYTRSLVLYDVQRYKNKTFHRINFNGNAMKRIKFINEFILRNINRSNPIPKKKLKEVVIENMKNEVKDYQIQKLKDQINIMKIRNRSLHNHLKFIKKGCNK
ncbi:MAG: hypothetical protein KJ571_01625 [Bacteroidetes bacterium]|nr:hypothetical protein [Bacteroidota bacterium]